MNMDKRKIKIAWKQIQIFRFTLRDFVKAQIFQRIMQRSQTLCLCGSVAILLLSSNCTTLRPQAITFTQSQTAAERQMIGEGKDLEKDGWIISSIRTSASG